MSLIALIILLAVLPVVFMFAVDWRLSKIHKELRLLNEAAQQHINEGEPK